MDGLGRFIHRVRATVESGGLVLTKDTWVIRIGPWAWTRSRPVSVRIPGSGAETPVADPTRTAVVAVVMGAVAVSTLVTLVHMVATRRDAWKQNDRRSSNIS